jgi:hypothetical protein
LEINQIGEAGCDYIGQALTPSKNVPLLKLNLSFNKFGTKGLENLTFGLRMNPTLESLSLNNCDIDAEGAKYLQ